MDSIDPKADNTVAQMRKIIHVDMDAFYASVEQLDHPELRGKPVAVGGSKERGVIMAASYEARKFGLRSAMPSVKAYRLCPEVIFMPPRFTRYKELSTMIREVFYAWTNLVEPLSLDEAYLDITENNFGELSARAAAMAIKEQVKEKTGLTASAGVSFNKFLAKIASDYRKPDGVFVIPPAKAQQFIDELAVKKFFGIGKVTAKKMKGMGIETGADLRKLSEAELAGSFGKAGRFYFKIVRAIDDRPVEPNRARKSISVETTFESDHTQLAPLANSLEKLADELWKRMERTGLKGKTLTLKVKYSDFTIASRSRTIDRYFDDLTEIVAIGKELLEGGADLEKGVRLLGLGCSKLNTEEEDGGNDSQLELAL